MTLLAHHGFNGKSRIRADILNVYPLPREPIPFPFDKSDLLAVLSLWYKRKSGYLHILTVCCGGKLFSCYAMIRRVRVLLSAVTSD